MKKIFIGVIALLLLCSHDMFLKMDNYFFEPQTEGVLQLFNGTFDESENIIDRNRMIDASLVGNGKRIAVDSTKWFERDSITFLSFKTGNAGTWVAGVSTAARNIALDATAFNRYLENDGILDMIALRKENNTTGEDAVEKYAKHVKTIFQVGDTTSDDWKVDLGYPIEFIPLENPYEIHPGHSLPVRLMYKGEKLANQWVYVGVETQQSTGHSHEDESAHSHSESTHSHSDTPQETLEHSHSESAHSHSDTPQETREHSHSESAHSHSDTPQETREHSHSENTHSHSDTPQETREHSHSDESTSTHSHADEEPHHHAHENTQPEAHSHGDGKPHTHEEVDEAPKDHEHTRPLKKLRTNDDGVVNIDITEEGIWYLRTIRMELSQEQGLTHESNWATLTFAIGSGHGHTHDEEEGAHTHQEDGFPSYIFWIGSLLVLGGLFFFFKKK